MFDDVHGTIDQVTPEKPFALARQLLRELLENPSVGADRHNSDTASLPEVLVLQLCDGTLESRTTSIGRPLHHPSLLFQRVAVGKG